MDTNQVFISGKIKRLSKIEKIAGYKLDGYRLELEIQRTNPDVTDRIIVIVPKDKFIWSGESFLPPQDIKIQGSLQSIKDFRKSRVLIFVYANYIEFVQAVPENVVYISGEVAREVNNRRTPLGKNITEVFLKVPSALYKGFCYIPSIVWGTGADVEAKYQKGDRVTAQGRLQSREYTKKIENTTYTRTAYELSIRRIAKRD